MLNANDYFSRIPKVLDARRSSFPLNQSVTTTFAAGELIPITWYEVLPGDTFNMDDAFAVRMATPIAPTFGDAFCDIYAFYCPNRILWDHWREFCGENTAGPWAPDVKYSIPQLVLDNGFDEQSIGDYLGAPLGYSGTSISALPFRMVDRVWSEWFRSSAVQNPGKLYTGDASVMNATRFAGFTIENASNGGHPYPVDRLHDYFSSALPQPQYGDALTLKAGDLISTGPLYLTPSTGSDAGLANFGFQLKSSTPLDWSKSGDSGLSSSLDVSMKYSKGLGIDWTTTVNDLRLFFQTQKFQEKLAYGGSRYREILHTLFGVYPPDASIQIPEYLGGKRVKLGVQQVLQTSATPSGSGNGNNMLGQTGAFSFTGNSSHMFTRSFTEHGIVMIFACVRTQSIYSQRIDRKWSRKEFLDFYNPVFANIGNQPILNKELYVASPSPSGPGVHTVADEDVFGYQEAWAEYRYHPNQVTGYMRPESSKSLAVWNYADHYDVRPVLNDEWMRSPAADAIARTTRYFEPDTPVQFIGEFLFTGSISRVMPTFSVPGLLDHH